MDAVRTAWGWWSTPFGERCRGHGIPLPEGFSVQGCIMWYAHAHGRVRVFAGVGACLGAGVRA